MPHNDIWFQTILVVSAFLLYFNSLNSGFVWDDRAAVVTNPDVISPIMSYNMTILMNELVNTFHHDFWGQDIKLMDSHKSYRPVTTLTYRLNYIIHGLNAYGYHLLNVIIYAVTVLCVYQMYKQWISSKSVIGCRLSSLLFCFHPIHVEAVSSIVGRADCLCGLFFVLSLYFYHNNSYHNKFSPSIGLSVFFGVLACLSKEIGATTFLMFSAIDIIHIIINKRLFVDQANWKNYFMLSFRVMLSTGCIASFLLMRRHLQGDFHLYSWTVTENHINLLPSFKERLLSYSQSHFWYLIKLIYPRHLSFDYGYACIPMIQSYVDIRNLLPLMAYSSLAFTALYGLWMESSVLLFGIALFIIPLIPASNIVFPVGTILAERLLFIPSIGYCMIFAYLLENMILPFHKAYIVEKATTVLQENLSVRRSNLAYSLLPLLITTVSILCLYGARVVTRNYDWRSEERIYRSALYICPLSVKALSNFAALNIQDDKNALIASRRAAMLYSGHSVPYSNAGLVYRSKEDWFKSVLNFELALRINAEDDKVAGLLSNTLMSWANTLDPNVTVYIKERAMLLVEALENKGYQSPVFFHAVGSAELEKGNIDKAVAMFKQALNVTVKLKALKASGVQFDEHMDESLIWNQLGNAYMSVMNVDESLAAFKNAIEINPKLIAPYVNIGSLLRYAGKYDDAIQFMEIGRKLSDNDDEVSSALLNNLGLIYLDKQQFQQALKLFQQALTNYYREKQMNGLGVSNNGEYRLGNDFSMSNNEVNSNGVDGIINENINKAMRGLGQNN